MNSKLIDPHLDAIPADEISEQERQERLNSPMRHGLSIKDTIADAADHSIGSAGVGTSGVDAGPKLDEHLSETVKSPKELQDLDQE